MVMNFANMSIIIIISIILPILVIGVKNSAKSCAMICR